MTSTIEPGPASDTPASRAPGNVGDQLSIADIAGALRALPHGGIDDTTRSFELPPAVRATVAPVVGALRWGAVLFGMVFAAVDASVDGNMKMVYALSVALFLATWRSVQPNRLASPRLLDRVLIHTDMIVLSIAAGLGGDFASPFVFCVMTVAVIGAFGWGVRTGLGLILLGSTGLLIGGRFAEPPSESFFEGIRTQSGLVILASMLIAVGLASFARVRLLDAERRRLELAGQLETLNEANDLLQVLNQVARTLPNSLNLREATSTAAEQLKRTFGAETICLVVHDEPNGEWVPQLTEGCVVKPTSTTEELPAALTAALSASTPVLTRHSDGGETSVAGKTGAGLYASLSARGNVVGLLGLEHPDPSRWTERDVNVLAGLADVMALSIDNARWFGRLRTLGADEERTRIARDLHDRLGQWLTYINFELERIITADGSEHSELMGLHSDVQSAIDELRETLRQLRTGVSQDEPLEQVAGTLIDRFAERTGTNVEFAVSSPGARLSVPVENELLRILQEALNNTDKHAKAENIWVGWDVENGGGQLTIRDDGRGFDTDSGVRESAYGLVGMRERADVAGARLNIESAKGEGTLITVTVDSTREEIRR